MKETSTDFSSVHFNNDIKLKQSLNASNKPDLSTNKFSITYKSENVKPYVGPLQHTRSRLPTTPDIDYSRGGSDFRVLERTTSFGKQSLTLKKTAERTAFGKTNRFSSSHTLGPGPATVSPYSSLKRQCISKYPTAGRMSFGTMYREDALKTYTVYTCKKF